MSAIAAAAALAIYLRARQRSAAAPLRGAAVGLVAAGVAAAAVIWGWLAVHDDAQDDATLDQTVASARALPMVGMVLDDVPGAEQRLRESLREEMRRPTTEGVSRPLKLMRELRAEYVVPALRAADDASATAVIEARSALLRHLQETELTVCKEFALTGIQHTERLDLAGQKMLREVLAALEAAYRSGRAAKDRPAGKTLSDTEARILLTQAGFTAEDFDRLAHLARLPEAEACAIALKFNEAPASLPADKRSPLMHYLLTVQ
ncbi:MAG: hypothetical protein U1E23_05240 [Reyranellaceae bacterium]